MYILGQKANPMKSLTDLSQELSISKRTLQRRLAEFEKEERYKHLRYSVIRDGGVVLVNLLAFMDFMAYREQLADRNARKFIPPYEPKKVAYEIGLYEMEVTK